jgi:hypothetical protein
LLTIRGVGLTTTSEVFTQNQFVEDATAAGNIRKITVSVIHVGTDGTWEVGGGSSTAIVYDDLISANAAQLMTNKTLTAPTISTILNIGTLTLPTSSTTLVGTNTSDTLANKTLTAPVISTISNGGTVTLPTSTTTLIGTNTSDTLTNKTIDATVNTISNLNHGTEVDDPSSGVHGVVGSVVGTTDAQTLTNKTITKPLIGGYIQSDVLSGNPAYGEGRVFYDIGEHALAVYNDESEVTHQVGQEGFIRVYNESGATITNGSVVYISGTETVEDRPSISLARSDTLATSKVIGIATHDIEDTSFGYITYWGTVNDVNTSAYAVGDVLYLDETTAGAIRNSPPPAGNFAVLIGFVVKSNASTGKIVSTINPTLDNVIGNARQILIAVQKDSPGTLNVGQAVHIVGYDAVDDVLTVELADASSSATMPALGILQDSVTDTSTGAVVVVGTLDGQDTSSYSVGDALFVSETAGELTNVKPAGSALVQKIGIVSESAVNGIIAIIGAGRTNDLPNLAQNNVWSGNASGVPVATQDLVLNSVTTDSVDASTATILVVGGAVATKVEIADTGIVTEVQGPLDALEGVDVTGNIVVSGTVDGVDVAGHVAATTTHGVSGDIVGTTDAQTLTNKTMAMAGDLTMAGNDVVIPDNTADAFSITEGANPYITIDTTDSAELITLAKTTSIERYNPSFNSVTISTSYTVTKDDKNSFLFTASASNNVVTLPDATTLPNGWAITIQNADASTTGLIVRDNGLNTIYNIGAGGVLSLVLNDNGSSDGEWHENVPHDHMIINVAIKGGEFNSVKDAIDSITDNSSTVRYMVKVGPGIFTEDAIAMKEYVEVIGSGINTTTITASAATQTIITGVRNSSIRYIHLTGASGSGGIGVSMSDAGSAADNPVFAAANVKIDTCETCASTVGAISFVNRCSLNLTSVQLNGPFSNGVVVTGNVGIAICSYVVSRATGDASMLNAVKVEGPGANFLSSTANYVGANAGNGILIRTGASVNLGSSKIQNMATAINVENSGTGSHVDISGAITASNTNDLIVAQPTATGTITGVFERAKTTISSDGVVVQLQDPTEVGTTLNGNLFIGKTIATSANVTELINNGTMGVINGGGLSDGSGLDVDVAAGFGYLVSSEYTGDTDDGHKIVRHEWIATTISLTANTTNYIYVNAVGVVVSSSSRVSNTANIILGRVVTAASALEFIDQSRISADHYGNYSSEYNREVMGVQYVSGSTVSNNASRELAVTAGVFYYNGTRFAPSGATSPASFFQYNHSSGSFTFSAQTVVNNTQYDDGTDLTALTSSYYVKHLLYVVGDGAAERYMLVIGQEEFSTLLEAQSGNLPNPPTYFDEGVSRLDSFIMQEGVTTIVETVDERPRLSGAAGASAAVTDHGALTGLGDDDHMQYLLVSGTRAMTGNLDMNSGNINNAGTINGLDITAHAARHGANSADPLSTAAPTTDIGGGTSNAVGVADTFARSDHQHGLDSSVIVTTGAQTMTDKTLTAPVLNAVATLNLDDTDSAFNLALVSTSGITTTDKTLVFDVNDSNRILSLGGDISTAGAFNTVGAFDLTLTQTGATNVTLPTTGTLVTLVGSETLANKTIDASVNTITNLSHGVEVDDPSSGVHGVTGSVVGTTDAQPLTNKTIDASANTITNLTHGVEVDDPSSGVHGVTGSVVGTIDAQTLTNKTLTSPIIGTSILDVNGQELLLLNPVASAVNEFSLINAISGESPELSTSGNDVNIDMLFTTKGSSTFNFNASSASNAAEIRLFDDTGGDYIGLKAAAVVTSYTLTLPTVQGASGQILETDGSGNFSWTGQGVYSDELFEVFDDGDVTKTIEFELSGATASTTTTIAASQTANHTVTLFDATDTVVGLATADTITNKTISDPSNTVGANEIRTTGASVTVDSSDPPTIGQTLVTTSATNATWQNQQVGWKTPTRVATTQDLGSEGTGYAYANTSGAKLRGQITWSVGPSVLDGVTLINGNRILVKDNSVLDSNGIWVRTSADVWDRADDFDDDHEVVSLSTMWVEEGTVSGEVTYYLTTDNPATIGGLSGSPIAFTSLQLNTDSVVCQARRTTTLGSSTGYVDINFDATDIENNSAIISHTGTTITFGETGVYSVEYFLMLFPTANDPQTTDARIVLNNSTELPGSVNTSGGDRNNNIYHWHSNNKKIVREFTAGDTITVQFRASGIMTLQGDATVVATRLRGTRGANGVDGAEGAPGDIIWTGAWSGATSYIVNETVERNGSSYVCTANHTNQEPPNASFWDLVSLGGAVGPSGDIDWQGPWDSGTAYVVTNTVESDGSSYRCAINNTNQQPPNANWELVALKGDVGNTGPQGPSGDIVWTNDWNGGTSYIVNEAVSSGGASYVCNTAHSNQVPPNAAFWDVLAEKGDQGIQGVPGPNTVTTIYLTAGSEASGVTSTSNAAFGSMVDVIAGMTTTPPAGTYTISFSANTGCVNRTQFTRTEMYVGGAGLGHSQRSNQVRANGQRSPVHSQAQVALTGSEVVEMRYSGSGTAGAVIYGRSLILTKIA